MCSLGTGDMKHLLLAEQYEIITLLCPSKQEKMHFEFFFFQAEDGIRDIGVTGVQTCALPISTPVRRCRCRRAPSARSRGLHRISTLATASSIPSPWRGTWAKSAQNSAST